MCVGLFFILTSPVLAGSIRGECRCCTTSSKAITSLGDLGPADNLKILRDRCQAHCRDEVGVCGSTDYEIRSESCVISTESVTRVDDAMIISRCEAAVAAPATPSPTPAPTKTYEAIPTKGIDVPTPLGTTDVPVLIGRIIKSVLGIVGSIALLMFMYGGFMWLMSAGSPERVKKGQQALVWASIGLAVIFASYAMVNFVINSLVSSGGSSDTSSTTDITDLEEWFREHPMSEWRSNPFDEAELKEFLEGSDIREEDFEDLTGVELD